MRGRGVLVAVALAVVGFCIGLVGRHTAAAIGVLLGYLFVWFVRNAILSRVRVGRSASPRGPRRATSRPSSTTGHQYYVPTAPSAAEGVGVDYVERTVSLPTA